MTSSYPLEDNGKSNGNSSHVPKLRFKGYNDEWVETKTKELFENISIKNNSFLPVLAVTQDKGVILREDCGIKIKYKNESLKSYKLVQPGNFIISLRSFQGGLEYSDLKGIVSPAYTILNNTQEVSYVFFKYYFKTYNFIKSLNIAVEGIRDGKQISYNSFKDINVTFPSLLEQEKIASFLTLIDKKIEKQKELVELLKKYKRGLLFAIFDQKLRFKDKHGNDYPQWKVKRIEDVCTIRTGKGNTQDKEKNGIYPFYVRSPIIERSNKYIFNGEAVLTVGDGVGTGKVFHYVNGKFNFHQRVYKMSDFIDINGKYFYYYFSTHFYDRVKRITAKTSVDSVRMDMIAKMPILIPCSKEQEKIVNLLTNIENTYLKNENKLFFLQEYKKGLLQKMFI